MNKADHIFVTGGTGFIGSSILRHFIRHGYSSISAMRRRESPMDLVADIQHQINWVEADLFDYESIRSVLQSVDVVIHAAAKISFWPRERKHMMRANVDGTAHIVNASLEGRVRQFLHISSVSALGKNPHGGPTDETHTFDYGAKNTAYGLSKYLAEMEVWRGASEGLQVCMINPTMVFGGGFWNQGTANIVRTVAKGLSYFPVGQGGFVDVRDVAAISRLALEKNIEDEKIIACSASIPIRSLLTQIAEQLHVKPPTKPLTPWLRAIAWRAEWARAALLGKQPLITRETMRSSANISQYNNEKSKSLLDFSYRPITQTIDDMCTCYKEAMQADQRFGILNE